MEGWVACVVGEQLLRLLMNSHIRLPDVFIQSDFSIRRQVIEEPVGVKPLEYQ